MLTLITLIGSIDGRANIIAGSLQIAKHHSGILRALKLKTQYILVKLVLQNIVQMHKYIITQTILQLNRCYLSK